VCLSSSYRRKLCDVSCNDYNAIAEKSIAIRGPDLAGTPVDVEKLLTATGADFIYDQNQHIGKIESVVVAATCVVTEVCRNVRTLVNRKHGV